MRRTADGQLDRSYLEWYVDATGAVLVAGQHSGAATFSAHFNGASANVGQALQPEHDQLRSYLWLNQRSAVPNRVRQDL